MNRLHYYFYIGILFKLLHTSLNSNIATKSYASAMFGVRSTQMLVEIYNINELQKSSEINNEVKLI